MGTPKGKFQENNVECTSTTGGYPQKGTKLWTNKRKSKQTEATTNVPQKETVASHNAPHPPPLPRWERANPREKAKKQRNYRRKSAPTHSLVAGGSGPAGPRVVDGSTKQVGR